MITLMGMGPAAELPLGDVYAALVAQIAEGDERALARFYDCTSRLVYGLALRILREASAAEDVTMEVYLQVWRTAASYSRERGSVTSWLAMAVRSRSADWLRSPHGRFAKQSEPLDDVAGRADAGPDPERTSIEAGRSRLIVRSMAALPAEQKQAIEMAFYSGLSHGEIAERLGLPLGTVKTRIRLGMARLRDSLAGYAEGAL